QLSAFDFRVNVADAFAADVVGCPVCYFRQLRPRPRPEELAACYADDYFDSSGGTGFGDYAKQRQRHHREAWILARELRKLAPTGKLLEVGSALGFLLEGLEQHCDWEVSGLDLSEFGVRFATDRLKVDARCATLESAGLAPASVGYMVQKDLLEHVERPRDHMVETARVMRPGGRVWLVTPNGEANLAPLRRLGQNDLQNFPDLLPLLDQAHVSFFTRNNLEKLFDDCGFRVLRLRNISIKRGLRSLGHLPAKRKPPTGSAQPSPPQTKASDGAAFAKVADRMEAELLRHHKASRAWPAYFMFRHVQDMFDSLPARPVWGNDFEFLLEKR
ncbi:MAG: 2-polyprenyl-3-methyl-5-hydroxy-6-metoxy-1,4-benzoquinol methylase, partial [Candidatus Krumholzibacteriia bacterium]